MIWPFHIELSTLPLFQSSVQGPVGDSLYITLKRLDSPPSKPGVIYLNSSVGDNDLDKSIAGVTK